MSGLIDAITNLLFAIAAVGLVVFLLSIRKPLGSLLAALATRERSQLLRKIVPLLDRDGEGR
jgi:hypothetical protein